MTHEFDPGVRGIRGRWPDPPQYWSYTALRDVQACPRRWSLRRAQYPDLWEGNGYPPRPGVAALAGTAVHRCLELILEAFAAADCEGPRDPEAIQVLRSLGGFSELTERALDDVLADLADNPRMTRALPAIRTSLLRQVPDLRIRLQSLVARMRMASMGDSGTGIPSETSSRGLRRGSHAEVELKVEDPPLRGVADLVTITPDACAIVDYKSGSEHEEHDEQLHFYQTLWMLDLRRNPDRIPVTTLEVMYPEADRSVAPLSTEELNARVESLREETSRLRDEIARRPPRALPSPENCGYCTVRHLCGDYWDSEVPSGLPKDGFGDALVRILGPQGDRSWRVVHAPSGVETLLHVAVDNVALEPESLVRLIDAAFSAADPEEPPVITLTTFSESYVLS